MLPGDYYSYGRPHSRCLLRRRKLARNILFETTLSASDTVNHFLVKKSIKKGKFFQKVLDIKHLTFIF